MTSPAAGPRVHLFFGPDEFSRREALRALRDQLDDGNLAHNTTRFDATREAVGIEEIIAACHTASFFADQRFVVVEGLLERLGGGRRGGSARGRRSPTARASDSDRFLEGLSDLPPSTTVVLLEESPPRAVVEALSGTADVRSFPVLRADAVRAWAQRRAAAVGASLAPAAAARLSELIDGHHLGDLAQEIDKLAAYTGGRPIDLDDIDSVVSVALQFQTWDLTDAVASGRSDRALRVLQQMDEKQHPAQLLFSMVVRQYRQLMLVKAAKDEGLPDAEIGRKLGIAHPFPLSKYIEQSRRYPPDALDRAYRRLLETDVAVKTGVMDIEPALEMLIGELAGLTAGGRVPAGRR